MRTMEEEILLSNVGREIGAGWFKAAIDSSKNTEQLENQVFTLQAACVHLLATIAFNRELSNTYDVKFYAKEVSNLIEIEVDIFHDEFEAGNLEHVKDPGPRRPLEIVP